VIHAPLLLLIIPVYYLYLDSLTGAKTNLNTRKHIILFLPATALIVVNLISLIIIPAHKLELYLSNLYNYSDANAQFLQRINILGFGILLSGQLIFLFKKFYWLHKTSRFLFKYSFLVASSPLRFSINSAYSAFSSFLLLFCATG